jgi:hypothetical protein
MNKMERKQREENGEEIRKYTTLHKTRLAIKIPFALNCNIS